MKINKNITIIILFLLQTSCYNNNTNIIPNKSPTSNKEVKMDPSKEQNNTQSKAEPVIESNNNETQKEQDDYFYLKENKLNLKVNDIFDLKEVIISNNLNIKDNIKYLSLDTEIIYIEGSKITALKEGASKIEISYKNTNLVLDINVTKEEIINDTFKEKFILRGRVYDIYNNPLESVTVDAIAMGSEVNWKGETQISKKDGYFEFGFSPVGVRILMTAKKEGWTTRSTTLVFKTNIEIPLEESFFDFEDKDALQDEPEITLIKINGKAFTGSGKILQEGEVPYPEITPNIISDKNKISLEVQFSEPISKSDFENNFKILSGVFIRDGVIKRFFTHLKKEDFIFNWARNRTKVNIEIDKILLSNKDGKESVFSIEIPNIALVDDNGKNALPHSIDHLLGTIKFVSKTSADNVVFSIKNDTEPPKLLSIRAISNLNSLDVVELYFSEPLESIGFKSPLAILNYNDSGFSSSDGDLMLLSTNNKNVYSIAQIESDLDGTSFKNIGITGSLKDISVDKDKVTLYLSENTLIKGKTLVVSVGKVPDIKGIDFKEVEFEQLQDPSGNIIKNGNETIIKNITVSNIQNNTIIK